MDLAGSKVEFKVAEAIYIKADGKDEGILHHGNTIPYFTVLCTRYNVNKNLNNIRVHRICSSHTI